MNIRTFAIGFVASLTIMLVLATFGAFAATPLGTTFTYQGQLKLAGVPLNGATDFEFRLFDALSGGVHVGSANSVSNVNVAEGLFTVPLDFGSSVFNGDQRWLEIAVRSPGERQRSARANQRLGRVPVTQSLSQMVTSHLLGLILLQHPAKQATRNTATSAPHRLLTLSVLYKRSI